MKNLLIYWFELSQNVSKHCVKKRNDISTWKNSFRTTFMSSPLLSPIVLVLSQHEFRKVCVSRCLFVISSPLVYGEINHVTELGTKLKLSPKKNKSSSLTNNFSFLLSFSLCSTELFSKKKTFSSEEIFLA